MYVLAYALMCKEGQIFNIKCFVMVIDIIKVQAIWDSLDADSLAVEDIDEQKIAEVFFSVGNKLDMAQIDNFYTEVIVWRLKTKR